MCAYSWFGDALVQYEETEGALGRLEIPEIGVSLPIYPETDEQALQNGVGHIAGTGLPGESDNAHCMLAGHRGLPGKTLLTHLDQVYIGDQFYIYLEGEQLVYEVCDIQTMRPEEVQTSTLEMGRELVSIITCTPYGIHTHRLVVTGERVNEKKNENNNMDCRYDSNGKYSAFCIGSREGEYSRGTAKRTEWRKCLLLGRGGKRNCNTGR